MAPFQEMPMKTARLIVLAGLMALSAAAHAADGQIVVRSMKGEFKEVKERVLHALENRGLVLNYTARIGAMLERTGKDIGAGRQLYSDAELLEFCSARISRDTMEADPRNIVFCPYGIAIYAVPKEPGKVYLAYRRQRASGSDRSAKSLQAVDRLLAEIVGEAMK
jgi:uncharacterized protein (DUF302 family)